MLRFIKILVEARPAIKFAIRMLRRYIPLALLMIVGCDEKDVARDRDHVNAMQREVTQASREFITADANARAGWVEAQKSFEHTREAMVKQQSDIQHGLNVLESERKSIASWRVYDMVSAGMLQSLGIVIGCSVPLLLLGWLMQRYWQSERAYLLNELGATQAGQAEDFPVDAELLRQWSPQKSTPLIDPKFVNNQEPENWLLDA